MGLLGRRAAARALVLLGACLAFAAATPPAEQSPFLLDGKAAAAFCARPSFSSVPCGFATPAEDEPTTKNQCPLCGTVFSGVPPELPATLGQRSSAFSYATRVLSLACKGPLVVRSVFKILRQLPAAQLGGGDGANGAGGSCAATRLMPPAAGGATVRCKLQLPPGPPGTEEARALASKEGPCWVCNSCADGGGCPNELNTWYSDATLVPAAPGCAFDRSKGYEAQRVGILLNPETKIRLAKFEACSNPGCFDRGYEEGKLKAARRCVRGVCPP